MTTSHDTTRNPSGPRPSGAPRAGASAAPGQYLLFRIASEAYAVGVVETSEVLEYRPPTPVPGAPPWVPGLLAIRGKPVPVVDLAAKFGIPDRRPGDSACIVVVDLPIDGELSRLGILVDDMPAVIQLAAEQIAEPPRFGTLVHVRYLRGMARLESGLVLLLDAAGALTAEETALLSSLEAQVEQHEAWSDGPPTGATGNTPER
jgi:purine-binding chemotaxis protein CheW